MTVVPASVDSVPTDMMPAAFLGHGNPMNALESNRYTATWAAFGRAVPRPRAILVVSAHWYTGATAITSMTRPRTIHDFYGFPQELFDVEYPAPGDPEIADLVADVVKPTWVGHDVDSWGIDHGTWSVLVHAFPDASIPVLQLSLNAFKEPERHYELGRTLAALRSKGVLIISSGNVVHNLRTLDMSRPDTGFDWAQRFDDSARELLIDDPSRILTLDGHTDYDKAVPTPDHYLPLLYLAGLADTTPLDVLVEGYAAGSLSMTCYSLGLDPATVAEIGAASSVGHPGGRGNTAAELPSSFPALDSNI